LYGPLSPPPASGGWALPARARSANGAAPRAGQHAVAAGGTGVMGMAPADGNDVATSNSGGVLLLQPPHALLEPTTAGSIARHTSAAAAARRRRVHHGRTHSSRKHQHQPLQRRAGRSNSTTDSRASSARPTRVVKTPNIPMNGYGEPSVSSAWSGHEERSSRSSSSKQQQQQPPPPPPPQQQPALAPNTGHQCSHHRDCVLGDGHAGFCQLEPASHNREEGVAPAAAFVLVHGLAQQRQQSEMPANQAVQRRRQRQRQRRPTQ
jgi:hypothetical protein